MASNTPNERGDAQRKETTSSSRREHHRDDVDYGRGQQQRASDWSEPFERRRVIRDDGAVDDARVRRWEAPTKPEVEHEAWSRADQAELWHRQQERWTRGAEESHRGQATWTTEGIAPEQDAFGGAHGPPAREAHRSDAQVREDVARRLAEHDYIDASDIHVRVEGGEAVVSGTVPDRHSLRMVELAVGDSAGVSKMTSHLRVVAREEPVKEETPAEALSKAQEREQGRDKETRVEACDGSMKRRDPSDD